jgi:branched-chain amino acid transport system ATP-binding protein
VRFNGDPVTLDSADGRARRGICTVPEGRGIFPNLSVRENLLMATQVGVPMNRIEEVAIAQFPRLGPKRKQLAGTLSGGEQ